MPFIIETFDKPGHQAVRQAHRPAHLGFLDTHKHLLLACGAKLADDGSDLAGAGIRMEEFPACNQYALQAHAFARAVLNEAEWPYPIENAVANMRVIDALFRSGQSGKWEAVG